MSQNVTVSVEGNDVVVRIPRNQLPFPRSKGTPAKPGKNHLVATTSGFKTTTMKLGDVEIPLQVSVNVITPPEFANGTAPAAA